MQGWDSVMIKADVELGGTDQLFNLLVGRQLQEQCEQAPQICLTLPLINGLDGRKMSKSYGNSIPFTDSAKDMFGKVMRITDDAMRSWFTLLTDVPATEVDALLAGDLREAKARLGEELASFFHGRESGRGARAAFDRQFRDKEVPEDVPEIDWPAQLGSQVPLSILLRELKLADSSSDARRLVAQGGVKLAGQAVTDPMFAVAKPSQPLLIQVGKRRFARVR
jgi:tyrosyl-tRNA synthetase